MRVNPASVQALAREIFEYELTDDAAASVARISARPMRSRPG